MVAAGLLLLNACATTSQSPITQSPTPIAIYQQHLAELAQIKSFSLKGRLGVVTEKKGFSGGVDWQHTFNSDNVDVYSPVGGKVANISKTASGVTLITQDNRSVSAPDAESLTENTLGFKLPLLGLSDWALGKPTKSHIDASTWDENGRLLTLKQDGWDISYENYTEIQGVFLPNKIVLKSEKVNLKLLVENWIEITN
ncbi:MAG: lipoprotein insertase outer membrane protein LolB [Pseudomonadota bacterium]